MAAIDPGARAYLEEAQELLAELEACLLELETNPDDADKLNRAFRAMHTIKGSGAMFGFEEIARFTHDIETVYDRVRNHKLPLTPELSALTLRAKDHIQALLNSGAPVATPELVAISDALLAEFAAISKASDSAEAPAQASAPPPPVNGKTVSANARTYWVRYRPTSKTMFTGTRPLALLDELTQLGDSRILFHDEDVPPVEDLDPEHVYGWWDVLVATDRGEDAIRDVFIFLDDEREVSVLALSDGIIRASDVEEILERFRTEAARPMTEVGESIRANLTLKLAGRRKPEASAAGRETIARSAGGGSIRVDSSRLDKLVNLVGELVIIQSRLSQAVGGQSEQSALVQISEDMERLTDEMRENALGLRMLPIGTTFGAFRRLVHDLCGSLGKEVELVTDGADTELDKTVIDQLKDPLVHILRNCLDHGIESPEDREAQGKPRTGTIQLAASHSSGNVVISIADDGKGIDPVVIRAKAVEKGLVSPDADLTEREVLNLIFEPGFSTAKTVSDVSGRGVGMDVVRRHIDALRGSVEIESHKGKGTTLVIRLPLTLAIIDGFNVLIGHESFIVPLTSLRGFQERFVTPPVKKLDVIERMGSRIPCVSLRQLFNVPGEQPEYERVVITEVEDAVVGLTVDQVVGRQQAVIKSMAQEFKSLKWISGTTINGDGSISLILDVPQLVRFASSLAAGKDAPRQ